MAHIEREPFGLTYERYAVGKRLAKMKKQYDIHSVLEIPGSGIKAMPSIYSICLGLAGCKVAVVNGERSSLAVWQRLGIEDRISFLEFDDLANTELPDKSFDFVWSFVVFGTFESPEIILKEMQRVSKRYVCLFISNKRNIGYYFHRFAHWYAKIPWTHGNVNLRIPKYIKNMMTAQGMNIKKVGYVDTPPWPDSTGFRDIRLHRLQMEKKVDLASAEWKSDYVDYLVLNRFPLWIKLIFAFEGIPAPLILKQLYSHLFYIIGEVKR